MEKYPVIHMMDGASNFNSGVIRGVRQAAWLGEIPEFIIVGIKNTNRSEDIFPEEVTCPDGTNDGGRANFALHANAQPGAMVIALDNFHVTGGHDREKNGGRA